MRVISIAVKVLLIAVIGGVHKSLGLTRGYWKSTESPSETSVVVSEASKDVASVTTQVTWNKDVVGRQPVPDEKDGVDDGLIRPWPARKRGQSRRGHGHFHDHYPDFPLTTSTTSQPKRKVTDNKSGMNEKIGPTPASFRYKEPLRHEMETGGKLSGHVQVFAPGHAESLQDRRQLDREFELLPGFQSSSKDQDQDDPIWSDKNLDTQSPSSNCSSGFKEHLEDVKNRLGKSLVQAGGGLLEDEISGGSNSPSCSNVLIFVPALAMYGLLLILTVVGKYTVWGQKVCNFVFRKLFHHYGQSHLSLDTMGSHV